MKAILAVLATLALASPVPARAQAPTYTQSSPANCRLAGYVCQNVRFDGGDYSIICDASQLYVGRGFNIYVDGVLHAGKITEVTKQAPPMRAGTDGEFSFNWSTSDGLTGSVSGTVEFFAVGKWTMPVIESSTVTVYLVATVPNE